LVEEGARILVGREIAALPAPVGPRAGEPVEHLASVGLADLAIGLGPLTERLLVGDRAPQPGRHLRLLDAAQARRHAGFAEIFLRQDVGRDLAPVLRHGEVLEPEDDGAIGIADFRRGAAERNFLVRRFARLGEAPLDLHWYWPRACWLARPAQGATLA